MTREFTILKSIKTFIYTFLSFVIMSCSAGYISTETNTAIPPVIDPLDISLFTEINCKEDIAPPTGWIWRSMLLPDKVEEDKKYKYISCVFIAHLNPDSLEIDAGVYLEIDEYKNLADLQVNSESAKITDVSGSPFKINIVNVGDATYYDCLQLDDLVTCLTKSQYSHREFITRITIGKNPSVGIVEDFINSILGQMDKVLKDMP